MSGNAPKSIALMPRGSDGRFQPLLAEVSAKEFVTKALGDYVNVVVDVDWGKLLPLISSALEMIRENEINDSFRGLWSHWHDSSSYRDGPVRQQKFIEVSRWSIEVLAKLKGAVEDRRASLNCHSDASPESALGMCSQYLATLMCCVHVKRELEISSFNSDVVFSTYARWIEALLLDAYGRCMDAWRGEIGFGSHLYALALDEDPDLSLYTLALEGVARIDADLRFEFVKRNMNREKWQEEIVINGALKRKSARHHHLAMRLRDLTLWAKAVSALINSLSTPSIGSGLDE